MKKAPADAPKAELHILLEALVVTITKFNALKDEKDSLKDKERQAREQLEAATTGERMDDDETARKVRAASIMISTIEGRRGHLTKALKPVLATLKDQLRAVDRKWSGIVAAHRDRDEARYNAAIAPFYPDAGPHEIPHFQTTGAFNAINKALWNAEGGAITSMTEDNARQTINGFVCQVESWADSFNLGILDTE
jgi:hypothetical protein